MGNTRAANRRTPSIKAAVTRLDNLMNYTIRITNNHNRFPKSVRYTITDRLINKLLSANGNARAASRIEVYNKITFKRFRHYLQRAIDDLAEFESLMILANTYCDPSNFDYWAILESEAYKGLTEWMSYEIKRNNERKRKKRSQKQEEKKSYYLEYKNFNPDNPKESLLVRK